MTKKELPRHVYAKKGGAIYFQRRGFKTVRFATKPGTPEFAAEYAAILRGRAPVPEGRTLRALVISYQLSDRFTDLAPRTRADYLKVLEFVKSKLGHLPAERMQRKDVIRAQHSNKEAVRFANYIVQVLRVMFEHAIDQGWRNDNPAKGVRLLKSGRPPRLPWPAEMIAAFRQATSIGTRSRLIFELLLGTGQRIGDVLKMRWDDLESGGVNVRQSKTGAALWIPLTSSLREALGATSKVGLTICAQPNGRPTSYDGAHALLMAVRKDIGAEAYDMHALRHTATHELAAAGCSDETIQAVTGHSTVAMVAHYAGSARQRTRAKEAQSRREQNRCET
ncbi:integrase [Paracoccus yeei]|uniref:Integrase n=1 Tax=Paracoccus yeei TaxID=147645 RepID=A0A1V0GRY5_9RHOB|nr:tyrosine-type recombinase/integrase [Paracoccus yeei]ARC36625.1 integrase [Paracoccus yeei]